MSTIEFKRVSNDKNGNPRYVCHFLNIASNYEDAIRLAHKIGGRKFSNKQYGGGIIFQSFNLDTLEKAILAISEKKTVSEEKRFIVINTLLHDWPEIEREEDGTPLIFSSVEEAQRVANNCTTAFVVELKD